MSKKRNNEFQRNLEQQVTDRLRSKLAIGESKHNDKLNKVDTTQKIYSWGSYHTYHKQCKAFVKWIKSAHPKATNLQKAKKYIAEYLTKQIDKGCSAWTVHTQAQSLNKLYGIKKGDKNFFECPKRERVNIIRSRYERDSDSHYSLKNNYELTEFCRSTGLRRSEVTKLQGNDVVTRHQLEKRAEKNNPPKIAKMINDALNFPQNYEYFVFVKCGKGGRARLAPIIGAKSKAIYDKIKNTPKDKPVFEHIHSKADIHSYRSDYATTLYNATARPIDTIPYDKVTKSGHKFQSEVYHCRREQAGIHLDRRAMLYTSKALGHNRLEVVANNYIRY